MRLLNHFLRPPVEIVFLGDSITEWWARYSPSLFGRRCPNSGVGGENTHGMLARFEHDVIAPRPRAVHIMGGTNDLWHTMSPKAPGRVLANVEQMLNMTRGAKIVPFLASIPPVNPQFEASGPAWAPMIAPLNEELRALAARYAAGFIDYARALGPDGYMAAPYSDDGVHPNRAGYAVMTRVWQHVLAEESAGAAQ